MEGFQILKEKAIAMALCKALPRWTTTTLLRSIDKASKQDFGSEASKDTQSPTEWLRRLREDTLRSNEMM
ncbi:hypothetical protein Tco_1215487 [Tanacetum coccineum]